MSDCCKKGVGSRIKPVQHINLAKDAGLKNEGFELDSSRMALDADSALQQHQNAHT